MVGERHIVKLHAALGCHQVLRAWFVLQGRPQLTVSASKSFSKENSFAEIWKSTFSHIQSHSRRIEKQCLEKQQCVQTNAPHTGFHIGLNACRMQVSKAKDALVTIMQF